MTEEEYKLKNAYDKGYAHALRDEAHRQHRERLSIANEDPTGQDLDDFLERTHEPDDFSHIDCPIQRAERQFGC
jgi:hypothetical protein